MTIWDVRCCAPLDPTMIADAARHELVVTCEDGIRDGGVGMTMADRVHHACGTDPLPHVEVLGVPTRFIPTAKPDRILAGLGLDGEGIAATVRGLADLRWVGTDDLDAELELALELADRADAITLPHFRAADLLVEHKADRSEVTEADRGSEAAIRARPDRGPARPRGARRGGGPDRAGRRPGAVDRRPDRRHVELREGHPDLGHADRARARWRARGRRGLRPGTGPPLVGGPGRGRLRGRASHHGVVVATLEEAHLAYSDVGSFYDHGSGDALVALSRRAWRARGLGDFWMHVLVAEGAFDVAVEPVVSLWDLAAVQVIVEEAGGRFTSLDGVAQADAGSVCSTNGVLHDEVLAAFAR